MITIPYTKHDSVRPRGGSADLGAFLSGVSCRNETTPAAFLDSVMVTVDAANPSLAALHYAADLVCPRGGALDVLLYLDGRGEPEVGFGQGETTTYLVKEWHAMVREAIAVTRSRVHDFGERRELSINILDDSVRSGDAIVRASREASCLVVGRRGRGVRQGGLSRRAIAQILGRTSEAVLVTPPEWRSIQRVRAVLGSPRDDGAVLHTAAGTGETVRAPLDLVTIAGECERAVTTRPGDLAETCIWRNGTDCLLVAGRGSWSGPAEDRREDAADSILRSIDGPLLCVSTSLAAGVDDFGHEPIAAGAERGREVDSDVPIAVS